MIARREFIRAGGLGLAGLAGFPVVLRRLRVRGEVVEIYMRSDHTGGKVWFDPVGIHVDQGQVVRWIVAENVHTTTAYHPNNGGRPLRIPPDSEPWDSGYLINPGDTFDTRLTVQGVYDYLCVPHEAAGMVGRIVVGDPAVAPAAPDSSLPSAVRQAFPSVEQIVNERLVR